MNNQNKGIVIGIGGLFSGGFVASVAHLPMWPKTCLVAMASSVVSSILLLVLRPGKIK